MPYDGGMSEQVAAIAELHALRQQVAAQLEQIAERDRCIESHAQALAERNERIDSQQRELKQRDFKIDALTHEIARLKRLQYGAKTEALSSLQSELFADTVAEELGAAEQALEQTDAAEATSPADAPVTRPAKATPKSQALPPELPRITTVHEPARGCACTTCAADLVKIGEHVSGAGVRAIFVASPGSVGSLGRAALEFTSKRCKAMVRSVALGSFGVAVETLTKWAASPASPTTA
jgi:hypothetical protein